MADFDKVFDAIRNCVTEPKCRDCPWDKCFDSKRASVPVNLLLDALKLLKEQKEEIENLRQVAQSMMEGICLMKEQDPVPPDVDSEETCSCGNCGATVGYYPAGCKTPEKLCKYCPECGKMVKWE